MLSDYIYNPSKPPFEKGGFENSEAEAKAFEMAEGDVIRVEVSGGYYGWFFSNEYNGQYSQAQAILDMRLKALQGLDREKLENEYKELEEKIEQLAPGRFAD